MRDKPQVPREGASAPTPTRIRSVERAARLLTLVASMPESDCKVQNLAERLGASTATTYHLLNTLADARLLARNERRRYRLGLAVGNLAFAYLHQAVPPSELSAPLEAVVRNTGESAYFSAWRHGEPEVLLQLSGTRAVRVMDLEPGFHGVAHARASGKVLLAFAPPEARDRYLAIHPLEPITAQTITDACALLKEIEMVTAQGYAVDYEEFREGVGCISVPVIDGAFLLGAYTVSAPIDRCRRHKDEFLRILKSAARSVLPPQQHELDGDSDSRHSSQGAESA